MNGEGVKSERLTEWKCRIREREIPLASSNPPLRQYGEIINSSPWAAERVEDNWKW